MKQFKNGRQKVAWFQKKNPVVLCLEMKSDQSPFTTFSFSVMKFHETIAVTLVCVKLQEELIGISAGLMGWQPVKDECFLISRTIQI